MANEDGWKGWANYAGWVAPSPRDDLYSDPVWVTPLRNGSPEPGEVWMWEGRDVTIVTPPFWDTPEAGKCCVVRFHEDNYAGLVGIYGRLRLVHTHDLIPLPQTRKWKVRGYPMILEATDIDDLREQLAALADDAEVVE